MMPSFSVLLAAFCAARASVLPAPDAPLDASILARGKKHSSLPTTFNWTSTGPLIAPKNDTRNIAGIKDPSIVQIGKTYHVFASTAQASGYNLIYLNFTDFSKANATPFYYLDQSAIGTGYRAAPEVFYFAPHKLWYLIYQNGNAAYSTNKNIGDPAGWSAPTNFYSGRPEIVEDNIGEGYWVDMWVICDKVDCHLFSSDDNGHLYRSQTKLADFPAGMSEPVIAMEDTDNKYALYEAACVYKIQGEEKYLLLIEAIGTDSNRYFRSWTAESIAGEWTALADTEENPFARSNNVAFNKGVAAWTKSISHGEVIRTMTDQTLTIDPRNLRFLYQGMDPAAGGEYNALPWRLALITQTNH